jgi:predicted RNA-binding protein with PUA-like domain
MAKQFWLMKSEPDQFGIADLARVSIEPWTGVRSYFARAHMRAMAVGDAVLFHHSNATPPGVAGLARVVRTQVVDQTQFDPNSPYYDPKATREQPIWDCVEVEYVATLPHFVAMDRIRAEPALADMLVVRRGMRLSVQPVTEAEYETIVALGHTAPPVLEPAAAPRRSGAPAPGPDRPARPAAAVRAPSAAARTRARSAAGSRRPASARPASARPASARPASARPASARPASARPASAKPAAAKPAAAKSAAAKPAPARSATASAAARPTRSTRSARPARR